VSREEVINIAVALLAPILTAVLGVLGLVFGDWRQRRTEAGRRKLSLEDASRQVQFASEWWSARKLLAESPEAVQQATARAGAWLEEAYEVVAASKPPPVEEKQPITLRRLLLLYPLQSRAANAIRVLYYFALGWLLAWAGSMLNNIFVPETAKEDLFGNIAIVSASAVLALGLRFWAERAEKRRVARGKPRRISFDRALLFYDFHRRAARVVRAIFYIYSVLSAILVILLLWSGWDDPHYLAGNVVFCVILILYAVGFRYWAVSLEERHEIEASLVVTTATATDDSGTRKLITP
jgi:hypothetical protein